MLVTPEPNEYYSFVRPYYGVQVAIHGQNIFPDFNKPITVQPGYNIRVFFQPYVLTTDEAVVKKTYKIIILLYFWQF